MVQLFHCFSLYYSLLEHCLFKKKYCFLLILLFLKKNLTFFFIGDNVGRIPSIFGQGSQEWTRIWYVFLFFSCFLLHSPSVSLCICIAAGFGSSPWVASDGLAFIFLCLRQVSQPTTQEAQYDARLFNQSAGMVGPKCREQQQQGMNVVCEAVSHEDQIGLS